MSLGGQRGYHSAREEERMEQNRDERLTYKNAEGYADPTCYFALRNVICEGKKKQNRPRDAPEYQRDGRGKKRFNTQVIHYDERGNEI